MIPIMSTYIYSPFPSQKHQISGHGWTRTNEAEAPDLQSGVIAAIRPTHNKKSVQRTPHTLK